MDQFVRKHEKMIAWLGGLGLPVSILVAGWLITSTIESSKLDSEYVKIALGILSVQNKDKDGNVLEPTPEEAVMRAWAVRLLNKKSPEKFSKEEQEALASGKQRIIGLSWISPMGPLKLHYGAELKPEDKDRIQKFQLEIGTAF